MSHMKVALGRFWRGFGVSVIIQASNGVLTL